MTYDTEGWRSAHDLGRWANARHPLPCDRMDLRDLMRPDDLGPSMVAGLGASYDVLAAAGTIRPRAKSAVAPVSVYHLEADGTRTFVRVDEPKCLGRKPRVKVVRPKPEVTLVSPVVRRASSEWASSTRPRDLVRET